MFEVNVFGSILITNKSLPLLRRHHNKKGGLNHFFFGGCPISSENNGRIIYISSAAGKITGTLTIIFKN